MATNDTVLLDGILDERVAHSVPSSRRDEAFEYFAVEQLLKGYDLSGEELRSGLVDGRDDGGIDACYLFVNGHLIRDADIDALPKRGADVVVWLVTSKHHDTFRQAPMDKLTCPR